MPTKTEAMQTTEEQRRAPKTFALVKDDLPNFRGHAALYRCDPPMSDDYGYDDEHKPTTYEYVIASTANVLGAVETYLFGSDKDGKVISWGELPGSTKGNYSHAEAFGNAGYIARATGEAA
jgi:hypothetical protein